MQGSTFREVAILMHSSARETLARSITRLYATLSKSGKMYGDRHKVRDAVLALTTDTDAPPCVRASAKFSPTGQRKPVKFGVVCATAPCKALSPLFPCRPAPCLYSDSGGSAPVYSETVVLHQP